MKTKKINERKVTKKEQASAHQHPEFWLWALALTAGLFAVFQVYGPALHGPFLFDDSYLPMNVPMWAHGTFLNSMRGVRPLLMASYWVNENLAGTETTQYHEWNIFFHFLNAVLVYFVVRKLLQLASAPASENLAIFAAGLFLLHPLETEAVSYIAGRSDSMSTVFFLGAYALFLYRRTEAIGWLDSVGVLALFGAAMATKENTVVLPALLLLTDYFWNPGFSLEGIRRNWRLYAPMVVGGVIGAVGVFRILGRADSAGFQTMPWYQYLFTQFRVFFVYLKLFVLPSGQTIDYDFPISQTILDQGAILGLLGIVALVVAAVYFQRRYPLASFGFLVFAILLAPTSSIIPIKDPIAERRAYLPMLGLLLIVLEGVRRLRIGKTALNTSLAAVLMIAAALTYQRNIVWSGAVPLWDDAVKKSPGKARPHFQLAFAYYSEGRCQDAEEHYQKVAAIEKPDYRLWVDWALADSCLNKPEDALQKLQKAAAIEKTAHVYTQIAKMYADTGRNAEAAEALNTAEGIDPNFETIYLYRALLFERANNLPAAIKEFRRALGVNPRSEQAMQGLEQIRLHARAQP